MSMISRLLVLSLTIASATSLSACSSHDKDQLESFVEAGLHKYLRYDSPDKQKSFKYVGRKYAAETSSSDLKQYGGFSIKNNDTEEERVFVIGKRDNYYMAETSMFANRYRGAFVSVGVDRRDDFAPYVNFHIEF